MKIKCIIVDDEPLARDLIASYIQKIENIEIVATCAHAMDAFQHIKEKRIDLVFLDINMPQVSGLKLIKSLSHPPKVIIITAHREYALEGFELDVVDYLLKPVSFSRLLKAIDKFYLQTSQPAQVMESRTTPAEEEFIYLKENKKVVKVYLSEIDYIEAMGEYVQVYVDGRRIIPKMSIKAAEELLSEKGFLRIHKSILVPLKKITAFTASTIEINKKKELPIGRSYKGPVLHALQYNGKLQEP